MAEHPTEKEEPMTFEERQELIDAAMRRDDLSADDILRLTIAARLNRASDSMFATALGGSDTPLNFWGKR